VISSLQHYVQNFSNSRNLSRQGRTETQLQMAWSLLNSLFMLIRIALLFQLVLVSSAFAKGLPKSVEEFREVCREYMATRTYKAFPAPNVGSTIYVPVENIVSGQTRFGFDRMVGQIADVIDTNGKDTLAYDKDDSGKGRSAYPKSEGRGGIYYRGRVYIYDRHHHTMANIYLGGETMPVFIAGDWSDLTPTEFEERRLKDGLVYPWGKDGKVQKIPDIWELEEDAFLSLPDLFMLKIKTKEKKNRHKIKSAKGADPSVLIKIDDGEPFLELNAVDPLHRNNFELPDLSKPLSFKKLSEISAILINEKANKVLNRSTILDTPTRTKDLDLQKIVDDYYSRPFTCRKILRQRR
jgi:hypothetical protein